MRNLKRQLLAGPYMIWIIGFILLPVVMILYYAFTTSSGSFTMSNALTITHPIFFQALLFSFFENCLNLYGYLSGIGISPCHDTEQHEVWTSGIYCLYLHPSDVDELHAPYSCMENAAVQ